MDCERVVTMWGAAPAWLELGPPVEIEGVMAREILGDWTHLPEHDRPPRYVADLPTQKPAARVVDRSDDRPPVPRTGPGKDIAELRGRHAGGKVVILFNGPSLAHHDLWALRRAGVPMIGMNRTFVGFPGYAGPDPDYLCVVDWFWLRYPEVRDHRGLINGSTHQAAHGYRAHRNFRMRPFSFDLDRDGYVCPIPCTTGHLTLQAAAYLGFTDLYCLGFDLNGRGSTHFDGTHASLNHPMAVAYHRQQAPLLAERGVRVWVTGSPDSRAPFPHAPFGALLAPVEAACA